MTYTAKDYSYLQGMPGFSQALLSNHFTLYQGYVAGTNKLAGNIASLSSGGGSGSPEYAELKRRFGFEFNGMRLHELYFANLGGDGKPGTDSKTAGLLVQAFGSYAQWESDFKATGKMRGIGWVILYQDAAAGRLFNQWINEHETGHLAGCEPLLVMDVFEHAYITDYGLKRADYIDAFFACIDWAAVGKRLK